MSESPIQALEGFIARKGIDTSSDRWRTRLPEPPEVAFAPDTSCFWNLETNKGPIKIRLLTDVAPKHAASTLYLTLLGFYDGLSFHRVISGFMAQGGCPLGTGTGGPGYVYEGEFGPDLRHDRPGLLSMANAGPGTDGSQFFLTFVPTPWLDGKHTIFGEVVDGMETLRSLEECGSRSGAPTERLVIERATTSIE
jgi:cyclophilin family peptidyl-prolyl cis-trans isomerase